jgi:hypothetical protein
MAFPHGFSCIATETFALTRLNHVQPGFLRPFFRAAVPCGLAYDFHRMKNTAFISKVIPQARSPPSVRFSQFQKIERRKG